MGTETADRQEMVCPKCGYRQAETFECHRCGVIFHQDRARVGRSSAPPRSAGHTGKTPQTSSWGKLLLAIGLSAIAVFLFYNRIAHRPIVHGPGMIAPHLPKQLHLRQAIPFRYKDYRITPLALFDIEARVLSIKRYRFDREADVAPYDVALGWGRMSDEAVLNAITITQSDRLYSWWTQRLPIPSRAIAVHSANMHLIPANRSIARQLGRVRRGHVIAIKGFLVRVDAPHWHWISSLTRQDTGLGACELIWVQDLAIRATRRRQ